MRTQKPAPLCNNEGLMLLMWYYIKQSWWCGII